jgi:formyl-CoA transferase
MNSIAPVDPKPGALAGLKIIDLTRVLGGPYCTQILADHGADVIKVEPPGGDETRGWGPPFGDASSGHAASYFIGVNRNKRGIALDIAQPAGRELLLALLEGADVLIENFKAGTLEKWGIGKAFLAERFPRLIHARVSGFGETGPYGGLPGYDAAVQALTGLMSINGQRDGPPTRIGVPVVDLVTGLYAAIGILLAINERHTSGKGQFIEASLYDCAIAILHPQLANFHLNGVVPQRAGNAHPNICPYDSFATGQGEVFLAVGNNGQFIKLCAMLGAPELAADERFISNAQRNQNRDALKERLEALLVSHSAADIAKRLIESGVPAAPVRTIDQVVADPHTHHSEMVVQLDGYTGTGSPVKLSRTPATVRSTPPAYAQDTDAVLAEKGIDPATYSSVLPRSLK